jgi:hypothetical protein
MTPHSDNAFSSDVDASRTPRTPHRKLKSSFWSFRDSLLATNLAHK